MECFERFCDLELSNKLSGQRRIQTYHLILVSEACNSVLKN